jgi:hypothetical protein
MKNKQNFGIGIIFVIILSFNVYAVTLSDQGTDVKLNNGSTLELGNLSVKIYDNATSGGLIFSQNFTNAIINGSWNVMLTNVSLEYGKDYYKDYIINGDDLSFDSQNRIMFTSPLGVISSEDILDSGIYDVDIYNISYSKIQSCFANEILKYVDGNWTCSNETNIQWNITTSYYLVNNSGVLIVNETILNQTIDARSANSDTNRSDADILLVASVYNETYIITSVNSSWKTNATDQLALINNIIEDNVSWNESYADSLYLGIGDQRYNETDLIDSMYNLSLSDVSNNLGNWSADKSDYYNTTQVDSIVTSLNDSWKTNVSDQLTLINAITQDNVSWNESHANTLYLNKTDQRYNETSLIVSVNDSWKTNSSNQLTLTDSMDNLSLSDVSDNVGNWSADKSTYYNKTEINTISDTINSSWKANATEQLTLINSMDNLSLSDVSDNVGNWSADKSDYWNTSTNLNLTNNVSVDNFFGNLNFSYVENVPDFSLTSNLINYLGNWSDDKTNYYNKTEIDTISNTINSSWKANATEQLTLINSMDNLSLSDISDNVGNWSQDKSDYWNTNTNLNLTNNVSVYLTGNVSADNFIGLINFSYIENVPEYSLILNLVSYLGNWSADKTKYYNTTQVNTIADTINSSWKSNASAQLTLINSMDNLSLSDVSNNIGNWSQDKTKYYNTTQVDTIATSVNNSWKANATEQLTLINSMDNLSLSDVSDNIGNWSANQSRYMLNDGDTATGNYTFNNTLLHIDSTNDRIGIGTDSPGAKFEVKGLTATENQLLFLRNNESTRYYLGVNNITEGQDFFIGGNSGDSFFITAGGYVGINDSNPTSTLDVRGSVNFDGRLTLDTSITGSGTSNFYINMHHGSAGTQEKYTQLIQQDGAFSIRPLNDDGSLNNTALTIENDGNVGIGTSAPSAKLEVKGNVSLNNTLYVTESGKVGIGTTNPSHELNVIGDVNITGDLYVNSSSVYLGDKKLSNENGELQYDGKNVTPAGMIVIFNGSCPTGWTEVEATRGRYVVGTPLGGTNGSMVGTALTNGENREVGKHSHSVDPPSTASGTQSASHTHTTDIGSHSHDHGYYNGGGNTGGAYATDSDHTGADTGEYTKRAAAPNAWRSYDDIRSTDIGDKTSGIQSTSHTHTTDISSFYSATNGTTDGTNAPYIQMTYCQKDPGSDYAEWIESDEQIEVGMIVSVDKTFDNKVVKTKTEYDNTILGIVSTKPGWIIGHETKTTVKLALAGQVPVKVTLHNGEINRGDVITSSSLEGYGMKATEDKRIVGIALSELNNNSKNIYKCEESLCGTIKILLDLSWKNSDKLLEKIEETQISILDLKQKKDSEILELKQENEIKQNQIDELIRRIEKLENEK